CSAVRARAHAPRRLRSLKRAMAPASTSRTVLKALPIPNVTAASPRDGRPRDCLGLKVRKTPPIGEDLRTCANKPTEQPTIDHRDIEWGQSLHNWGAGRFCRNVGTEGKWDIR